MDLLKEFFGNNDISKGLQLPRSPTIFVGFLKKVSTRPTQAVRNYSIGTSRRELSQKGSRGLMRVFRATECITFCEDIFILCSVRFEMDSFL
jgi:hypothetical protein